MWTRRDQWIDGVACSIAFELWGVSDVTQISDAQWAFAMEIAAARYAIKRNRKRTGCWLG